ncbi:MAG: hypothetical protein PVG58_10620 [Gammaproteobacteria bacterium]|jgi:serine/threonine-protein kinase
MDRFLSELKRRRVVRAALVYMGAAFVVMEAADLLVEAFQLPAVVFSIIGIGCVAGLPVALVLAWAFDIGPADAEELPDGSPAQTPWLTARSVTAVVVLVTFGVLLGMAPQFLLDNSEGPSSTALRRYEILLPEDAPIEFIGSAPLAVPSLAMAITPDGNRLVYAGSANGGGTRLYVRALSDFEVRALPGSDGAYAPFVSPDGRWIGFFAEDQLRIVPIDGGDARIVVETPNARGGAWWGDDRIVYNDREGNAHWWVPVTGGTPTRLHIDPEDDLSNGAVPLGREFQPLPDGERFLVTTPPGRVAAYAPGTGKLEPVMDIPVNVRVASGALVYAFGNDLLAVDFDADAPAVSGDGRLVGSELRRDDDLAQFVVSDQTLIYATGAPYGQRHLALVDLEGNVQRLEFPPARYVDASIDPEGRRLAVTIFENQADIWIYDLETLARRRLTRGGFNRGPHWSADGERIYFSSNRHSENGTAAIYRTSPDAGPGDGELVLEDARNLRIDQLHSSDRAVISVLAENQIADLYIADLRNGTMAAVAQRGNVVEALGQISPDGRWLALTVDASGRFEIVLQPMEGIPDLRIQVSTEGGEEPLWAPDMSQIFYRYGDTLYSVPISFDGDRPVPGRPVPVFQDPTWKNVLGFSYWRNPADGRFLILRADQPPTSRSLRVVEGWKNIGVKDR